MKLAQTIQLGDAIAHRGVVIVPLFPRQTPRAAYLTLDEALPLGFRVGEVDAAGSVPELLARNPLEHDVLLYDGEELVGAKQNRILNVTVLVPARSETRIPVSCVEEGRWSQRSAFFAAAGHHAYPALRRRKAETLAAEPMALGAAQAAVWEEVSAKSARLGVRSPTRAHADVFAARERDLAELRRAFPLQPGQSGAAVAVGGGVCLDYLSRPDAFTRLYPKLLDGYLLDALDAPVAPSKTSFEAFAAAVERAARSRRPSVGLGDDVRLRGDGVVGSALELDGELIQLSAYSSATDGAASRITRPSRRS